MATMQLKDAARLPDNAYTAGPYGTLSTLHYKFETNSSGVVVGANDATALQATEDVILGVIPKGTKMIDVLCVISNTFSDTSTFDLGFEYVDGEDVTAAAEDPDYFVDAGDYHDAVGVIRKTTGTAPITLPKDAYLVLLNNTAAQAEAGVMDIFITCELMGPA